MRRMSLMLAAAGFAAFAAAGPVPAADSAGESLADQLTAYLTTDDADVRERTLKSIEAMPDVTTESVAAALDTLALWPPIEPGLQQFSLAAEAGDPVDVFVRVPAGYDPAKRWPVVIGLHGTGGNGESFQRFVDRILGGRHNAFIIACPTELRGDTFYDDEPDGAMPFALVRELRRRYHVDSDRVYLTGYSLGGHGTMFVCLMHSDLFAAGIPMAGTLVVPQSEKLFPYVLPNLQNTPMLLVWGADDTGGPGGSPSPTDGIAGENRRVRSAADQLKLPLTAIELSGVGHANVSPPAELWHDTLRMTRTRNPAEVSQRSRYLGQAHAAWLRAIKFNGKPWTGNALPTITLKSGDNPDERMTQAVVDRLRFFSGKIEGQRITIDLRRISRLEVLLNDEMIDLDQPIEIVARGKTTFEGKAPRSVAVMLEEAARTWDFQRLYAARLVMKGSGRVKAE